MDEIGNTKGFQKRSSGHSELKSRESAVKSHEHAELQQKPTNRFLCDLTDAGKYSYAVCCGLALRNLYGDSTDNKLVVFIINYLLICIKLLLHLNRYNHFGLFQIDFINCFLCQ